VQRAVHKITAEVPADTTSDIGWHGKICNPNSENAEACRELIKKFLLGTGRNDPVDVHTIGSAHPSSGKAGYIRLIACNEKSAELVLHPNANEEALNVRVVWRSGAPSNQIIFRSVQTHNATLH